MFEIIDLTQPLNISSLSYPGTTRALVAEKLDIGEPDVLVSRLSVFDLHAGTHMDAPLHFDPNGKDIASLPLAILPILLVHINAPQIDAEAIPVDCQGHAILFSTGWERQVGTRDYFNGYPFISSDAATLLSRRGASLVGLDTPSVDDIPEKPAYPSHRILCGAGIPILEGLVNLNSLTPHLQTGQPVYLCAFPLPIQGLEASPVRAVALIHKVAGHLEKG